MAKQNSPSVNKLIHPLGPGEIDLCADLSQQPIAFAHYFHSHMQEITAYKLKLTPEVLAAIEECKKQQDAILKLKAVDWERLGETYITCFDL